MKLYLSGDGGEFCIGKITDKQYTFIEQKIEKDLDTNDKYVSSNKSIFWEGNVLDKPWDEYDDIAHCNSVHGENWWIGNQEGEMICDSYASETGTFEIDLENDDRLDFSDKNKKITLGWNQIDTFYDKGFQTLKSKDFSSDSLKHFLTNKDGITPCLIGTQSFERGDFFEFELPNNFEKSKLIIILTKFHFSKNDFISFVTNIFYDGERIEMNFLGDTRTKDLIHFCLECNYNPEINGNVDFDYSIEFRMSD